MKAAIGEDIDNETLGGAISKTKVSGVIDHKVKNDEEAILTLRGIVDKLGETTKAGFNRNASLDPLNQDKLYERIPSGAEQYSMHSLLECIVDANSFIEYKKDFGKTLITAYARIDGW